MTEKNRYQREALGRVREVLDADARVVEVSMPSGFGTHRTLASLASESDRWDKVVFVVLRPASIDHAVGCLVEEAPGRRVGLLGSGADVEVVTLSRARALAAEGRLEAGLILMEDMGAGHVEAVEEVAGSCPDSDVVAVAEAEVPADGFDPETFSFPVRVVECRNPYSGPGLR